MYYKLSCPVPKKQRPINEYLDLVQSNFFNWPLQNKFVFLKNLSSYFGVFFFVCLLFSWLIFNKTISTNVLLLSSLSISVFFIFLLLVRLFLGWTYIKTRLYEPAVFYEESGWYDGRVWIKSKNILIQDRLIYTYQVLPAISKILQALFITGTLFASLLIFLVFN